MYYTLQWNKGFIFVQLTILHEEPKPLAEMGAEVPGELQRIIKKTLEKRTSERYQTVQELLTDLKALKQERQFQQRLESR